MKNFIKKILNRIGSMLAFSEKGLLENTAILTAKQLAVSHTSFDSISDLTDVEFKVFSQNGEDGIIEWLVSKLPAIPKKFIEFGVENYQESNTRFLLMNRSWRGLVIDGSEVNINYIKSQSLYWQYDLAAITSFITAENINTIFQDSGFIDEIGVLSIDIDGNDYWVWEAIDTLNPAIIIIEYSAVLGDVYPITIPYQPDFYRMRAHFSGQYSGASIIALNFLAEKKGYTLLGTNSSGVNAFYLRNDLYPIVSNSIKNINIYPSRFSDTRNTKGELTFLRGEQRLGLIKNLSVVDVKTSVNQPIAEFGGLYSHEWQRGIPRKL